MVCCNKNCNTEATSSEEEISLKRGKTDKFKMHITTVLLDMLLQNATTDENKDFEVDCDEGDEIDVIRSYHSSAGKLQTSVESIF